MVGPGLKEQPLMEYSRCMYSFGQGGQHHLFVRLMGYHQHSLLLHKINDTKIIKKENDNDIQGSTVNKALVLVT